MYCTACGVKAASEGAKYCSACGTPLTSPADATQTAHSSHPEDSQSRKDGEYPDRGFYHDPLDMTALRWWSGQRWGEKVADRPSRRQLIREGRVPPPTTPLVDARPDTAQSGYFQDPAEPGQVRFWRGSAWDPIDVRPDPDWHGEPVKRPEQWTTRFRGLLIAGAVLGAVVLTAYLGPRFVAWWNSPGPTIQVSESTACLDASVLVLSAGAIGSPEQASEISDQAKALLREQTPNERLNAALKELANATGAYADAVGSYDGGGTGLTFSQQLTASEPIVTSMSAMMDASNAVMALCD